jgi:diaminopimelate epimerase
MNELTTKTQNSKLKISFHKMHGAGNDFVVLDSLSTPLPDGFDYARAAEVLCARHFGIGSDGLLTLEAGSTPGAAVRMRMWNPDGSEDMCGNGLRCVARLAFDLGHISQREFIAQTHAGLRCCAILENGLVRVEMGAPLFGFSEIPMQVVPRSATMQYALSVGNHVFENVVSLSTGSTHTVIFLEEELSEEEFQTLSPLLENHDLFPERTTVLWTRVADENDLRVRIWERGVGETLACGTGACAVAVAAQKTNRAGEFVGVQSKGGVLQIEWNTKNAAPIFMTGPAVSVFEGKALLHNK